MGFDKVLATTNKQILAKETSYRGSRIREVILHVISEIGRTDILLKNHDVRRFAYFRDAD